MHNPAIHKAGITPRIAASTGVLGIRRTSKYIPANPRNEPK